MATRARNQMKARHRTGPRTAVGKARVAKNALRHGLAVPVGASPQFNEEITNLAARIAGPDDRPSVRDAARRVAEATIDLERIRTAREANMQNLDAAIRDSGRGTDSAKVIAGHVKHLAHLERYRRRAQSRRKAAARELRQLELDQLDEADDVAFLMTASNVISTPATAEPPPARDAPPPPSVNQLAKRAEAECASGDVSDAAAENDALADNEPNQVPAAVEKTDPGDEPGDAGPPPHVLEARKPHWGLHPMKGIIWVEP